MQPTGSAPARDGARHPSPPLVALAVVHAALVVASLAAYPLLAGGGHVPAPYAPSRDALASLAAAAEALRWSAFLQLGAAVPLGLFTATAASRLHFLGVRAAGATIALFGGLSASAFLAISALCQWALADPGVATSAATVRALQLLAFGTGGPAHVMALGLLVAGLAVTAVLHGLVPRWLMPSGLAVSVAAELSWLSLVAPAAAPLLPLARFTALAWLVAAGALLPVARLGARQRAASAARGGAGAPGVVERPVRGGTP